MNQASRLHEYLKTHDATRLMAALALGIYQANICRLARRMVKSGAAGIVRQAPCQVTGRKAEFLTTDPARLPTRSQLDMFDGDAHAV